MIESSFLKKVLLILLPGGGSVGAGVDCVVDGVGDGVAGGKVDPLAKGGQVNRLGICWFSQSVKCETSEYIPRASTPAHP